MNIKFIFITSLLVFSITSLSCSKNKLNKRPNILLIMVDDMGFSDLGCMGSLIETPNIDRLANNGLLYSNFYNAGRCCPSRASLLTGLYPHKAGMGWMTSTDSRHPGYRGDLNDNCVMIGEVLGENDYACYMTGKWHLSSNRSNNPKKINRNWPNQRGFDYFFGHIQAGGNYYNNHLQLNGTKVKKPKNYYLTTEITKYTIQFLKQHFSSQKSKPFFSYVSYLAPHTPLQALPKDIKKYKGKFKKGWDVLRKKRLNRLKKKGIIPKNSTLSKRPSHLEKWDKLSFKDKKVWSRMMEVYAAQIDRVDQGIGKIIELLKENDAYDDTLIFFLSDNGASSESYGSNPKYEQLNKLGSKSSKYTYKEEWANVSNTPFRNYKYYVHEGGIATPLIVHWADGIKSPGRVVNQLGHIVDIFPTILEVTNSSYPTSYKEDSIYSLSGKSLYPNFKGKQYDRGPIFFEHEANCAVRDEKWKLVSKGKRVAPYQGKWELYNLKKDRTETNNLAARYPNKVKELGKLWDKWALENKVYPIDGRRGRDRIDGKKGRDRKKHKIKN